MKAQIDLITGRCDERGHYRRVIVSKSCDIYSRANTARPRLTSASPSSLAHTTMVACSPAISARCLVPSPWFAEFSEAAESPAAISTNAEMIVSIAPSKSPRAPGLGLPVFAAWFSQGSMAPNLQPEHPLSQWEVPDL